MTSLYVPPSRRGYESINGILLKIERIFQVIYDANAPESENTFSRKQIEDYRKLLLDNSLLLQNKEKETTYEAYLDNLIAIYNKLSPSSLKILLRSSGKQFKQDIDKMLFIPVIYDRIHYLPYNDFYSSLLSMYSASNKMFEINNEENIKITTNANYEMYKNDIIANNGVNYYTQPEIDMSNVPLNYRLDMSFIEEKIKENKTEIKLSEYCEYIFDLYKNKYKKGTEPIKIKRSKKQEPDAILSPKTKSKYYYADTISEPQNLNFFKRKMEDIYKQHIEEAKKLKLIIDTENPTSNQKAWYDIYIRYLFDLHNALYIPNIKIENMSKYIENYNSLEKQEFNIDLPEVCDEFQFGMAKYVNIYFPKRIYLLSNIFVALFLLDRGLIQDANRLNITNDKILDLFINIHKDNSLDDIESLSLSHYIYQKIQNVISELVNYVDVKRFETNQKYCIFKSGTYHLMRTIITYILYNLYNDTKINMKTIQTYMHIKDLFEDLNIFIQNIFLRIFQLNPIKRQPIQNINHILQAFEKQLEIMNYTYLYLWINTNKNTTEIDDARHYPEVYGQSIIFKDYGFNYNNYSWKTHEGIISFPIFSTIRWSHGLNLLTNYCFAYSKYLFSGLFVLDSNQTITNKYSNILKRDNNYMGNKLIAVIQLNLLISGMGNEPTLFLLFVFYITSTKRILIMSVRGRQITFPEIYDTLNITYRELHIISQYYSVVMFRLKSNKSIILCSPASHINQIFSLLDRKKYYLVNDPIKDNTKPIPVNTLLNVFMTDWEQIDVEEDEVNNFKIISNNCKKYRLLKND